MPDVTNPHMIYFECLFFNTQSALHSHFTPQEICSSLTNEKTKRVLERASKRKRSKYNNSVPPPARISSSFTSTCASKEYNEFLLNQRNEPFDRNLYPPRNLSHRGCNSTRKFDSPGNAYADTISILPMTNKSTQHYAEPERFLQLQQSNRYPHAPTTASWNNQSQEEVSLFSNILSLFETDQDQTLAPIHKACAHFADNHQFISMMLRSNSNCASLCVDLSGQPLSKSKEMVVPIRPSHNSQSETDYFVKDGQYPIHIAVSNNASVEVVRSLIYAFPAALSKPDCNGMLPLSLAIRFFRSAVDKVNMQATLELLLQCYPEAANSVDNRRNTALHYICMISSQRSAQRKWMLGGEKKNNLSISMEFMKRLAMANPKAIHRRNFNFLTPLELAQTTGNNYINDEMSNFLLNLACVEDEVECHDTL